MLFLPVPVMRTLFLAKASPDLLSAFLLSG